MPVYHKEPENDSPTRMTRKPYQSFACAVLHLSPISVYCNMDFLQSDLDKLKNESFDVRWLDALNWKSEDDLHSDLKLKLNLPSYYGENLHALDDCMQDLAIEDDGGMALVLKN